MRIPDRLVEYYDRSMNFIAFCLFPPPKPIGVKIGGHEITLIDIVLACYTIAIGAALAWYFANWLWWPATFLCMIMAMMVFEWML